MRHGETEWTLSGQHTGVSDIELTANGEKQAELLGKRLQKEKIQFDRVWVSPLQRVRRTCQLAGLIDQAEIDENLMEWNYGEFEGVKTTEIRKRYPDWTVFKGPIPGGESAEMVGKRADQMIEKILKEGSGTIALFSSGHFSRVFGARWLGLSPQEGRLFFLSTASLSVLGYEHEIPVFISWNDTAHLK